MPVKQTEPECIEDLCAIEHCVKDALSGVDGISVDTACGKGFASVCVFAHQSDYVGGQKLNRCKAVEWQATVEIEIETEDCTNPGSCTAGQAAQKIASILTCKRICGCIFRRRQIKRELRGKRGEELRTETYTVRYWTKPDCAE